MKVAIPSWQGRVSPVFDVAGTILVVELADGLERARERAALDTEEPHARAARLAQAGVRVLICGAISWPQEMALSSAGIEVISQVCGDVEQVLAAFASGRLRQDEFRMPGCGVRRRRRQGRLRRARE